jgi:putative hydrolase of the HAD superfamily
MAPFILVDFDDTLVDTGPRFRRRRDALFRFLASLGFGEEEAWKTHHEVVDRELLDLWGFGPFRLGPSFRDTYLRLAHDRGIPPDPNLARMAEALAGGFDEEPAPPLPGALEALRELVRHRQVALYTQSHYPEYQLGSVTSAGVLEILPRERVFITPEKDAPAYRRAALAAGAPSPEASLMVGNSIRADVNPALEAGAGAIWIDQGEPWHLDEARPVDRPFARARSFAEAVDQILSEGR